MTDFNSVTAVLTEGEREVLTETLPEPSKGSDYEQLFRITSKLLLNAYWCGVHEAQQKIRNKAESVYKKSKHYYMIRSDQLGF